MTKQPCANKEENDSNISSTPTEALLGKTLIKQKVLTTTINAMKDKDLVLLYFSASWCPPCQAFSPVLKEFYGLVHDSEKIEVVYVSSDRKPEEFETYYGKMPWLAIESAELKQNLANVLQIRGIPALIVLDVKTGMLVTNDARSDIQAVAGNSSKYKGVVARWKSKEPVPIGQGLPASAIFSIQGIISAILKNPVYIFGTIYFVKYLYRYFNATMKTAGNVTSIEDEPIPDNEF
jgi:nucleoredoxin